METIKVFKKVFKLNWVDITNKVREVVDVWEYYESPILDDRDTLWGKYKIERFKIIYLNWSEYLGWQWDEIEITLKQILPKYKVWDYLVSNKDSYVDYIKVSNIRIYNNWDIMYNNIPEDKLGKPSKEDLELYFR